MNICPLCGRSYPQGTEWCPEDTSLLYAQEDSNSLRDLQTGDLVGGKYEILGKIEGRSGAGLTYKARQINLERIVELRILPNGCLHRPSDHARFQREVATWGRLRSDHLVRLYDSGFVQQAPYMALEYLDGGSLRKQLELYGPLSTMQVRRLAQQILSALKVAHEAQVLHRDISPEALILSEERGGHFSCRLTGFGLAKPIGEDEDPTAITMTGQLMGDPAYMAPETIISGELGPASDLYSLGVSLYEILEGHRPFPGESLAELLAAHVRERPLPMRRVQEDPDLKRCIEGLMARDPLERFRSAEEAALSLQGGTESPRPWSQLLLYLGLLLLGSGLALFLLFLKSR